MRFTFQWYCMALLVSSMCQPAAGQLAAPETLASPGQTIELLENLSTLESIRLGSTGSPAEGAGGSGMAAMRGGWAAARVRPWELPAASNCCCNTSINFGSC